jgi:hypothetical protein
VLLLVVVYIPGNDSQRGHSEHINTPRAWLEPTPGLFRLLRSNLLDLDDGLLDLSHRLLDLNDRLLDLDGRVLDLVGRLLDLARRLLTLNDMLLDTSTAGSSILSSGFSFSTAEFLISSSCFWCSMAGFWILAADFLAPRPALTAQAGIVIGVGCGRLALPSSSFGSSSSSRCFLGGKRGVKGGNRDRGNNYGPMDVRIEEYTYLTRYQLGIYEILRSDPSAMALSFAMFTPQPGQSPCKCKSRPVPSLVPACSVEISKFPPCCGKRQVWVLMHSRGGWPRLHLTPRRSLAFHLAASPRSSLLTAIQTFPPSEGSYPTWADERVT